jgi:trans-2,3-dihydro-3-hydroxyanthranilate isomerase
MQLHIVDVFAERRYAGNQLAVVRDATALSTDEMQDIAREMNFSETTFVCREQDDRATVRIFTPSIELPFAGHPTVGTAWVLAGGTGTFTLDMPVGEVPVRFADGIGWMVPPEVAFTGTLPPAQAADLVGLGEDDLDPEFPVRLAHVGPKFVLIGLRSLEALKRARLNQTLHAQLLVQDVAVQCVFPFTAEAYTADADFAARMFFESAGYREDPATGSANSAFAAYLRDLFGTPRSYVVDQGVEMKRPSRLYLNVSGQLEVGGRTQPVLTGTLA